MTPAHRCRVDVHDRVLCLEITADELERLEDGNGPLHTGESLPRELLDLGPIADDADDGSAVALRDMGLGPDVGKPLEDVLHVPAIRGRLHHDDQALISGHVDPSGGDRLEG